MLSFGLSTLTDFPFLQCLGRPWTTSSLNLVALGHSSRWTKLVDPEKYIAVGLESRQLSNLPIQQIFW